MAPQNTLESASPSRPARGTAGVLANDLSAAQVEALRLDERAVRVARGQGALELALGRTLGALFRGDRLLQLGFSKRDDYSRERIGVPPRTMRTWVALARGLETRPILRRAVTGGVVSPRKAREVLDAAVAEDEARWTAAAMRHTLAELRAMLRSEGHEPPDVLRFESLVLGMTPRQQDRLDVAIAIARDHLGPGRKDWEYLEAICQEWLGAHGAWVPEEAEAEARTAALTADPPASAPDLALAAQLAAVDEAHEVVDDGDGELARMGAAELQARVDRFMAARRESDAVFGPLAHRIRETRAWETLGYRSLEEYARERLGMSAQTVKQRAWLERRMTGLPELRDALAAGTVTYSKALLIAKDATPFTITERIEEAAGTTWQQLDRAATEKEKRQNRAAGVCRLWGPSDAGAAIVDAILSAQAWAEVAAGDQIGAGEALARIADHFAEVWGRHAVDPKPMSRRRREVLARTEGLCSVPGCSRPAEHVHHIVFRSQGGPKVSWNETGVCTPHHLHGIHRGYLTVRGRAGEALVWEFGAAEAVPLEVWLTKGGDHVMRVGM
jgi:hypothetical protein